MNPNIIKAVRGPTIGRNKNIPTIVGVINAGLLTEITSVPIHKPEAQKATGYQREPSKSRINSLSRGILERRVDLPTAVLLSERSNLLKDIIVNDEEFDIDLSKYDEVKFYIVDGQHRIASLKKAIDSNNVDPGIRKIKIPFICMIGATEIEEMTQFYTINDTAKSISTSLAFALLKERSAGDEQFAKHLSEETVEKWKVTAQEMTEKISSQKGGIWYRRIRLPNMEKGSTTATSANFAKSLKPILDLYIFKKLADLEKKVQVLTAYWNAVRNVIPEAFEDPLKYSIQKGIGIDVVHGIYPVIADSIRGSGNSLFEPNSYTTYLQNLLELTGVNGSGKQVTGADFWLTGRAGAAGSYSSIAGKRRLVEIIIANLEEE